MGQEVQLVACKKIPVPGGQKSHHAEEDEQVKQEESHSEHVLLVQEKYVPTGQLVHLLVFVASQV